MLIIKALFIGIVQGLTAFLPVSSSGQSMLLYTLLDMKTMSPVAFMAAGHLGSLAAIIFFMKKELLHILAEVVRIPGLIKKNLSDRFEQIRRGSVDPYKPVFTSNYGKITFLCLAGNIPTIVVGVFVHDLTERLSENILAVGMGFLISAVFLLVAAFLPNGKKVPQDLLLWQMLLVGVCQGVTVFPGVSRFAVTLAVFLLLGQTRKSSIICSMLMSVPVLAGAFCYTVGDLFVKGFSLEIFGVVVVCAIASALIGCLVIRGCLHLVQKCKLTVFSVYCFLLALGCIGCHLYLA